MRDHSLKFALVFAVIAVLSGWILAAGATGSVTSHPIERLVISRPDGEPAIILKTYQGPVAKLRGQPMIVLLQPGQTEAQADDDFEKALYKSALQIIEE